MQALSAHVEAAAKNSKKVICNLAFDEIEIRKELTIRNGKYHGYVEMGFGDPSDSDSQPLAKKALALLVCLNGRWKLPLAYFFVDSIDGGSLSKLVTTALQLVDDRGVIVRSMTYDDVGINHKCCKILRAELTYGPKFQP